MTVESDAAPVKQVNEPKRFRWFSRWRFIAVFLYSQIFWGISIPQVDSECFMITLPFLPVSYIIGSLTAWIIPNHELGYGLGAWLGVFLQAYLITSLVAMSLYGKPNKK